MIYWQRKAFLHPDFISIDPERDTLEALDTYVENITPDGRVNGNEEP